MVAGTFTVAQNRLTISKSSLNDIAVWQKTNFGKSQEVWAEIIDWKSLYGVELRMKDGLVAVGYSESFNGLPWLYITYSTVHGNPRLYREFPTLSPPFVLGGRAFEDGCVEIFASIRWVLVAAPKLARELGTLKDFAAAPWVGFGERTAHISAAR